MSFIEVLYAFDEILTKKNIEMFEEIKAQIKAKEMIEDTTEHQFYNFALKDVLKIIDDYMLEFNVIK